jgi:glycosyltransferase involved in cell wall biosynthesis
MKKKKILVISDHALYLSGVGVQTKCLIEGLIKKGDMTFIQLGGAVKHDSYETIMVTDDFYIKPIDGFGEPSILRSVLVNEKPDALVIFTDPRFFTWLFNMEDEVHQICPILWWHVWDNRPTPRFNDWMYEATDVINCHSYLTYQMCSENFPQKTNFIPHSFPKEMFYRLKKDNIQREKERILGQERKDNFVCLWMNRNCKRKRPADVLYSWSKFLKLITGEEEGNVTLLLHTDPKDKAGNNLIEIAKSLNILHTVAFSTQKLDTSFINILHNISDVTLNISFNEGFGLTTLESMMTGTPIIATKTGGLYRQVVDYRDNTENGVALDPDVTSMSGNQNVTSIFEDYVSCDNVAKAINKFFNMSIEEKNILSKKVEDYAIFEFNYEDTVNDWHESLNKAIKEFECQKKMIRTKIVYL